MNVEVNYKKDEIAIFGEDSVEIEGREISYDSIESISYNHDNAVYTILGIPIARWMSGAISISVIDEKKPVAVPFHGLSLFGITIVPSPQKAQEGFDMLYEAIDNVITPIIAQRYLEQIYAGGEVEVAGIVINQTSAFGKRKKDNIVSKENYGGTRHNFIIGTVLDKDFEVICRTSLKTCKNVTVLPYILDELFLVT